MRSFVLRLNSSLLLDELILWQREKGENTLHSWGTKIKQCVGDSSLIFYWFSAHNFKYKFFFSPGIFHPKIELIQIWKNFSNEGHPLFRSFMLQGFITLLWPWHWLNYYVFCKDFLQVHCTILLFRMTNGKQASNFFFGLKF